MRTNFLDQLCEHPDVSSYIYAGECLREFRDYKKVPVPEARFYYRNWEDWGSILDKPGLWLPLNCAIAVANSGAAHTAIGGTGNTSAINCTGATLLVAYAAEVAPATAIHDSTGSNTWVDLNAETGDFSLTARISYAANPTVSSSQTFNISGGSAPSICVIAFTGVSTTSPYDGQHSGISSDGSPTTQPGSVTPVNNDSLVITGLGGYNNQGPGFLTIDSGFTITDSILISPGNYFSTAIAYLVQSGAPSAVNPTWTWAGSNVGCASIACFKPTGTSTTVRHSLPYLGVG